ncbi:MAG TPA: FapA family protein [Limnochordia bacterium]|nr:FapA family protein [Limnochordia bacterium]
MNKAQGAEPQRKGLVGIQDGKVVLRAEPDALPPKLTPGPHVVLRVNGQVVEETVAVKPDDEVTVEAVQEAPTKEIHIQIAQDGSSAVALIQRRPGIAWAINDAPFAAHVTVNVRPAGQLPPPPVSVEDVLEALAKAGVVYGIDRAAIEELVAQEALECRAVVAKGRPPTPPVDGRVEPYRREQESSQPAADMREEALKIDLLDRGEIESVNPGDIVAVWIDPQPGQDGVDVKGQPVPARKPRSPQLRLGSGVEKQPDSPYIVAVRTGRPMVKETFVDVVPTFDVRGDVNVSTGHIEFAGNINVQRNVEESLRVRAGGSVVIGGMVFRKAEVLAGGSVTARGVVGGRIEAGGNASIYGPLIDALRRLEPLLEKAVENLRRIVPVLEADGAQERLGPVFKALLERHFPETGAIAQEIGKQLVQHKELIEPELLARLAQVVKLLAGRGPLQVKGLADVTSVLGVVQSLPLELDSRIEDADVRVDYLQNAEIACGGKVILRGRACFNSKIVARNGFEAPNATVRGGSITVTHGSVIAREIGSPSAALTEIIVGPEGSIKAEMIYPNVRCVVGQRQYRVDSPKRHLVLHLDRETGELRF